MAKPAMEIKTDKVAAIAKAIKRLPRHDVLVGYPADSAEREAGDAMTNPQLGYIHEHGAPEANIPARPHVMPGVRRAKPKYLPHLKAAAQAALKGQNGAISRELHKAGFVAVAEIQSILQAGVPPPLSDRTLRARASRKAGTGVRLGKGAAAELASRAAGNSPGMIFAKPLLDTGQLNRALNHVVRDGSS